MEITERAVERNLDWIEAVEESLATHGDQGLIREVMKAAGRRCARQILEDCAEILGKTPETVDEMLGATNRRRLERHNLANVWERVGDKAHLRIDECACTIVKAGLASPNPVHCECSRGLMESIFSEVCRGPVSVEVVRAIGFGDDCCEFDVRFVE
jgi:predicted hydrocarbon binding protein